MGAKQCTNSAAPPRSDTITIIKKVVQMTIRGLIPKISVTKNGEDFL